MLRKTTRERKVLEFERTKSPKFLWKAQPDAIKRSSYRGQDKQRRVSNYQISNSLRPCKHKKRTIWWAAKKVYTRSPCKTTIHYLEKESFESKTTLFKGEDKSRKSEMHNTFNNVHSSIKQVQGRDSKAQSKKEKLEIKSSYNTFKNSYDTDVMKSNPLCCPYLWGILLICT